MRTVVVVAVEPTTLAVKVLVRDGFREQFTAGFRLSAVLS